MGAIRGRVAWAAIAAALVAALTLSLGTVAAAAPNQLSSPAVTPSEGETTTTFGFSVHYSGRYPATSVTAVVGSRTVAMRLSSGSPSGGTYAGSSRLAAGTWTVTFNAIATQGNPPSISGGTVKVAGPTPSPRPSTAPTPTPAAKAIRTSTPAPISGGGLVSRSSPTPAATRAATSTPPAVALAGVAGEQPSGGGADGQPGETDMVPGAFWPIMLGGFGLIGLFVAYYVFAMDRDRRRRALAAEMADTAAESLATAGSRAEAARPPAVWELDARLEDAPVGTVEFLPLEDGTAIGSPPSELVEPPKPRRGNLRLARISEARKHRMVEDRHTLLRRS